VRASTLKPQTLSDFVARVDSAIVSSDGLEAWRKFLQKQTRTTGTLVDLEKKFLSIYGATGGTLHDMWVSYLTAEGYPGTESGMRQFFAEGEFFDDPVNDISWTTAYWAEDPNWTNPGDGNPVSSWAAAVGGTKPLTQGTADNRPTYQASVSGLNNQPAIRFDGTDDYLVCLEATFGAISQTDTVVMIFKNNDTGASTQIFSTGDSGVLNSIQMIRELGGSWQAFSGLNGLNGETVSDSAYLVRSYFASTSGVLEINGSATAGNNGNGTLRGLAVGASNGGTNPAEIDLAFWGVISGDITSLDKWTGFKAWASSHYGITIEG
jgi:hypothetical protein